MAPSTFLDYGSTHLLQLPQENNSWKTQVLHYIKKPSSITLYLSLSHKLCKKGYDKNITLSLQFDTFPQGLNII